MKESVWHRFPKNDYLRIISILKEMIQWPEKQISAKEKREILKLSDSIEKGFLIKENLNLSSNFLIVLIEFYLIENENNPSKKNLKKALNHFYNYELKGG